MLRLDAAQPPAFPAVPQGAIVPAIAGRQLLLGYDEKAAETALALAEQAETKTVSFGEGGLRKPKQAPLEFVINIKHKTVGGRSNWIATACFAACK